MNFSRLKLIPSQSPTILKTFMRRRNYERDIILYLTINKLSYLNLKHPQYFKYFHSLKQLTANPKIKQTLNKRLQTHS